MSLTLDESFDYCCSLARRTGRNFYFSFLTLPKPLRRDMCALYAFMRLTDDLGDDQSRSTSQRAAALKSWRHALDDALNGKPCSIRALPALIDIQKRHEIPPEHLHAVITGVEMDLDPKGFETFDELGVYCDHVAGAVGLCCLHIWGFNDPVAKVRAIDCGRAFQLTNILRDIGEDADLGRVYLPQDDLIQFSISREELKQKTCDDRFRQLMRFEVQRARGYYQNATELLALVKPPGRPILSSMLRIYGELLGQIERQDFDVFRRRIELSTFHKLAIAWQSWRNPDRAVKELLR